MLESYFKSPERLAQMRSGPLAEHIGDLAAKPLITHRIRSDDALEAYRLLTERPDQIVGMVLVWE